MVIVVEIEDRCSGKPFLGGWKNVVTGTEYHDACTQTCLRDMVAYTSGEKKRKDEAAALPPGSCFTRRAPNVITKTRDRCVGTDSSVLMLLLASYRSKYTSVASERATQTSGLPDLRDKFVIPFSPAHPQITRSPTNYHNKTFLITKISKPHTPDVKINEKTASDYSRLQVEAAMKIQKCYRAYRARVDFGALARLSRETRAQSPPQPDKIHHFRYCRASQFEIVNLVPPSKRSDFELLQSVLERWRFYENSRLEGGFFDTSKLAERGRILGREIQLLRSIETIKSRVRGERRERRYLDNLDKLAASEVWKVGNGQKKILVDTLRVQRARELRDFYRTLFDENISAKDRLEILKKLRLYAAQHTCKYAQDLVALVDQELQLFGINYDEKRTNSLRNRLKQALLRLTINSCSPGQKICGDDSTSRLSRETRNKKSSFSKLCKRCGKFLTIDDLAARIISPSQGLLPTCEDCRKFQPGKDAKIVYEPYDIMIEDLRMRETNLGSPAKSGQPAWIVDSRIIHRLVTYVWHGKSGISECDDLYRLVLVRFRPNNVWSPWNNLLLTKHEAALHQSMQDPWEIYAPTIIKKFVVKNLQAKLRFDMSMTTNFL